MQETITYLKVSYEGLAHEMSIPELVLRGSESDFATTTAWLPVSDYTEVELWTASVTVNDRRASRKP